MLKLFKLGGALTVTVNIVENGIRDPRANLG